MINIRVLKGCRLYEGEQDLLLRALQYQRLAYYVTDAPYVSRALSNK